jgi:hypothetical protein
MPMIMNTETLRAIQSPLKERYRTDPEAAQITLKAEGRIGQGLTCRVDTGKALVEGLHFELATSASEDELATLIRLTERYCVVYQTLRQPPEIRISRSVSGSGSKSRTAISTSSAE